MPAQNESPAPVSTSTWQRLSASSALITCSISAAMVGLMQLRFSGRFIVTQAIPSSNSTSTVLPPGTGASSIVAALACPDFILPSRTVKQ